MKKIDRYIASLPSLKEKKIIITGSNSGVGFAIADHCLTKGAKVVLACRSKERAEKAKESLLLKHPSSEVEIMLYDQSSLESCKGFADEIISNHNDFYALMLNAGVFRVNKGVTTIDGFPMVSGVNAFGLLMIVTRLQEFIENVKDEKRIIIQGSLSSHMEKYKDFENFLQNPNKPYFEQYANSKNISLNVFTYYARNSKNPNVKYLHSEPGISASNIIQNFPKAIRGICHFFYKLLFQPASEGALPAMDMICSDVENGTHSVPKLFWTSRGLPKRIKAKEKHIRFDVLIKMLDIINN